MLLNLSLSYSVNIRNLCAKVYLYLDKSEKKWRKVRKTARGGGGGGMGFLKSCTSMLKADAKS